MESLAHGLRAQFPRTNLPFARTRASTGDFAVATKLFFNGRSAVAAPLLHSVASCCRCLLVENETQVIRDLDTKPSKRYRGRSKIMSVAACSGGFDVVAFR